MSALSIIIVVVIAIAIALGLAYLPMRILLATIARNVNQFIQRQRERRGASRTTPERRKVV